MMLTLNSTLTLNRLERVVRKHRDCSGWPPGMYPVQEASMHDTKFMEMQMTADFHFCIVYLVSSEKKFLHLRTHFCSYRGQLLLILLLARVPSCLLWNFDALKHIKSFIHQDIVHIEQYVIIPFTPYSLTNDEKKLFLQSVVGRIKPIPLTPKWSNPFLRRQ